MNFFLVTLTSPTGHHNANPTAGDTGFREETASQILVKRTRISCEKVHTYLQKVELGFTSTLLQYRSGIGGKM